MLSPQKDTVSSQEENEIKEDQKTLKNNTSTSKTWGWLQDRKKEGI